jgi:tRNA(His) 5'-end guanylyltransferase
MIFRTLKEKCEYYRSLTDYRLLPNGYIMVMIDGKNFSTLIKNKFEKPFDEQFIEMMNKTAKYLCKNIQNCVGAFVQSDEISLVIRDTNETCVPFDGRMCKLLSIIPSIATSYFTKLMIEYELKLVPRFDHIFEMKDYVFDCKVWVVPNENDMLAWFLYRQIDCIKNSKNQFCQTYLSHNTLRGHNSDEQVKLCLEQTGNDWNLVSDDKKFGRFIYKSQVVKVNPEGQEYTRSVWDIVSYEIANKENREDLKNKWLNK